MSNRQHSVWSERRQLVYRSRFDALTGLRNRHGLLAATGNIFDRTPANLPATVLFAGLDKFKEINDRYGHGVGGEFVAVLPQRNGAEVKHIFDRIETRTDAWSMRYGLPMAVSLGVAHAPKDGHDLETLLSVADIHLYRRKSQQIDAEGAVAYYS